jgi:hypothetical protein
VPSWPQVRSGAAPANRRASAATGAASRSAIHHRAATVPVSASRDAGSAVRAADCPAILPVLMLQTPSRNSVVTTEIGTAPDAARYCSARFRFGDRASMIDSDESGRRHGEKSRGPCSTLAETGRCDNSMFSDYRRGLHLLETTQMCRHPISANKNRPRGGFA